MGKQETDQMIQELQKKMELLLVRRRNAKMKGCTVTLMGLSGNIRQIFDETGLTRLFF